MLERIKNHKQFCKQCKKPISYEKRRNKFCSHSCAILDHHPTYNKGEICYCKECDKRITSNKIFCDKKCENIFKWNVIIERIEEGNMDDPQIIRKYMFEKHGRNCFICKRKTWMGKETPIELDHIDGNSDNNLPSNLRLLCPNCHAQTPTYGSKNRGNGRTSRREYRKKKNLHY